MGREKRIAESRTKEILDKKQGDVRSETGRTETGRTEAGRGDVGRGEPGRGAASPSMPSAKPVRHTSTAQAIIQIVLLFLVPTFLIVIIGKLLFRL